MNPDIEHVLNEVLERAKGFGLSVNGRNGHGAHAGQLPLIVVSGRDMRDVSADALAALKQANTTPVLFVRSGALVRVLTDEKGRPRIENVGESSMRGQLARIADFRRVRAGDGSTNYTPIPPPLDIVRDVLALGEWPFPALHGLIEAPTLRPDGSIISAAGYDTATGLYHHAPEGLRVPDVPDAPTTQQVAEALNLLREPLADFPFADESSAANALALMLTPLYRPAIAGNVPLALVDAPQAGTGKTLLARVATAIATGQPDPAVITAPRDDDEWRKRITSALMIGGQLLTIDNLTGTLYSGQLCAALTTGTWADRALGGNAIVHLPQRATWIATGNNVRLGGDMPRRCFWIRLDAQTSRPFQRENFRHGDLIGWVLEHRGELIAAALTLARAWVNAGRPSGNPPRMGSFENWAHMLGGVLEFAGVRGYLANLDALLESADEEGFQWEAFILALAERFGSKPVTVAQICAAIESDAALAELVPAQFDAPTKPNVDGKPVITFAFKKQLGHEFAKRKGTRYGDSQARIERRADATHAKVAAWRIYGKEIEQKGGGYAGIAGKFSADIGSQKNIGTENGGKPTPPSPHIPPPLMPDM